MQEHHISHEHASDQWKHVPDACMPGHACVLRGLSERMHVRDSQFGCPVNQKPRPSDKSSEPRPSRAMASATFFQGFAASPSRNWMGASGSNRHSLSKVDLSTDFDAAAEAILVFRVSRNKIRPRSALVRTLESEGREATP